MRSITHILVSGIVLLLSACGNNVNSPASSPVPTASLTATASSLESGGSTTLSWNSTNATACAASGGWSGTLAASGTQSTGALTATTTYSLTCTGAGGSSAPATATVTVTTPTPAPTATLTAAPTGVASGGTATLTWSSTNATACTASGGWSGPLAASGTQPTAALTATTTYSLTCTGAGGTSAVATATVTVAATPPPVPVPTASLTAAPTAVASGAASTLTWSSTNATACTATGGWTGALAVSGTQSTGALTKNTSYSLTCTGPGGTSSVAIAAVTILPVPTVALTVSPTAVASGGNATLTWSSTNATSCIATNGWSGTLITAGTRNTGALTTATTYSLYCVGPGGTSATASATVTISATAIPTATLTASPTAIPAGGTSTLTWTSSNATACTASGGWSGTLATNGTQNVSPTANTTYSLTCTGPTGTSPAATATVTISPAPTATLTANPTIVGPSGASILTWSSTNATACTATGGWTGTLATSGTQSTGALTATTTYSLTCAGPGGTSPAATATVTVTAAAMSIAPTNAALTIGQTQQFTATVPGGGAATWTVDTIAGGNASVGVVTATGLYTAGTAPGVHNLIATSVANTTQTATAIAAVTDLAGIYTWHNNNSRNGANTQEYALTPTNVNPTSFGKLASCTVDGAVYAQPLWVANLTVAGARHNVVFVATEHDGLFAFDADSTACQVLWQANLIDTAHGAATGETTIPPHVVGVGDGDTVPEIGVTSTPVIDPTTNIIYVETKSVDSTLANFYHRLHAIDITTGLEKTGSPVLIAGTYPGTGDGGTVTTFNPKQEHQRSGLALVGGIVYIGWAAHEDDAPWYGWMMGYQYSGGAFTQTSVFNAAPNIAQNAAGAGIWMSGGAPPADSSGNLYVLTGNGEFNANNGNGTAPNNNYGDSMLKMTPALTVAAYFTPSDQASDVTNDNDFGAGGAALVADLPITGGTLHALLCGGKDGYLYLLNRDILGGYGDSAALQRIQLNGQVFDTGALWNNDYFLAGAGGSLSQFTPTLSATNVQYNLTASSSHVFMFPGATPSVSGSGTTNGIVWALDTHWYCTPSPRLGSGQKCYPVPLYAFNAANVNNVSPELWNNDINNTGVSTHSSDYGGYPVKFSVPTIANGHVYVGTRGNNTGGADSSTSIPGELDIYGLKP
jgi:hypothetical protein